MKAIRVVGHKDSGKTTLVEALVARLSETSRVATVKSIHHDIEFDTPGSDTYRHRTAGAETVVGVTPSFSFAIEAGGRSDPQFLGRTLESLERRDYHYVVVEGFKDATIPAVALGDIAAEEFAGPCLKRYPSGTSPDVEALRSVLSGMAPWTASSRGP